MWQAQLRGNKTWMLSPAPECDRQCNSFSFYVEPGDAGMIQIQFENMVWSRDRISMAISRTTLLAQHHRKWARIVMSEMARRILTVVTRLSALR